MKMNNIPNNCVYPGQYIPHPEMESFLNKAQDMIITGDHDARVNIDELDDCFKISVALPGVNLEDISMQVFNNILAIVVLHRIKKIPGMKLAHHEFNTDMLERYIVLPPHADAEFVSAHYQNGMLEIYMPKTANNCNTVMNEIIPY